MLKSIGVIGSGFAGLSNACYLAKAGHEVHVYERLDTLGGRARSFEKDGFTFDMGPSWYWMPEVFEAFFNDFGSSVSEHYDLKQLDPGYQIIFNAEKQEKIDIFASLEKTANTFEQLEKGAGVKLFQFLNEAETKYEKGMSDFVHKPSLSLAEFLSAKYLKDVFTLDLFSSFSKHVRKYFKHPQIIQAIEFPVLFLGALPKDTPALYSLMNYADLKLGTWYPIGGMNMIIQGMVSVAKTLGVQFHTNHDVKSLQHEGNKIKTAHFHNGNNASHDYWVSGADYNHTESLLDESVRNYSIKYWESKKLAPSSIIFYLGIDKKIPELIHHNLFFDADFEVHGEHLYTDKQFTKDPLFYTCAPSVTDETVAPEGKENLFILIPTPEGIMESDEIIEDYYLKVMTRLEAFTKTNIKEHVIVKETFTPTRFVHDYNSLRGNAYGLSNTLDQTAFLKPKIENKRLTNLLYTGQLTTPGPGVPPSLISGKVVANYLISKINKHETVTA